MEPDLAFAPAVALAGMVRDRVISPVELVDGYLDRIDRIDPHLNSFVTLDADRARDAARAAEASAGRPGTPAFHGVPIAIKDLHVTAGLRTTFGSKALADFVPDFDEESVRRIRAAGFVILGKTNVPEFGSLPVTEPLLHGPCRNPWDTERTPGGSSGGAAAALAAGLVPVSQGSDGGGSLRIPASNCGVFGLKPARGRVSNAPLFGDRLAGLSTTGVLARHVVDAAALLDVMAGYAPGDPHWAPPPARPFVKESATDPPPLRVGVVTSFPLAPFQREPLAAVESAAGLLTDLGHHVEPFALPVDAGVAEHFKLVWATGIAALPVDRALLEPFNAGLYDRGGTVSAPRLLQAINALQLASRTIVGASLAFDVVVSPTLAEPPLHIGEMRGLDVDATLARAAAYVGVTPVANITGQPSMSLPLGWSVEGLPIGVMVTGRPAGEATLLRLAGQVQRAADWSAARPPGG
ncbi:MAG TPA: amidase [Egibacteraceae bacterium]|nr:amidase [Egibacteraceae bacterium]